jgi:hypothetical protein
MTIETVDLNLNMQPQQQTEWCWAATATSINNFYLPASQLTQCWLVNVVFVVFWYQQMGVPAPNTFDCCPDPGKCNIPWGLTLPLQLCGNNGQAFGGSDGYGATASQIDLGRLVCAQIYWSGGASHFIAIDGYTLVTAPLRVGGPPEPVLEILHVEDPAYGPSDVSYTALQSSYKGQGAWGWTFYTQPPPPP